MLKNKKYAVCTILHRATREKKAIQFFVGNSFRIFSLTTNLYIWPIFLISGHYFANSWKRNGNPKNWTVLCSKVPLINIQYRFSNFFWIASELTKHFQIGTIYNFLLHFSILEVIRRRYTNRLDQTFPLFWKFYRQFSKSMFFRS